MVIALFVLVLFILVLLFNAIRVTVKARKLSPRKNLTDEATQIEYAKRLGQMIRCKTVSKENEFNEEEFSKLNSVMESLFPLVHKTAQRLTFGEDCWVYVIKGKDTSRNVMLMSHHDVVDVQGEWEHDGFCGEIYDGALWGRGTVDTKTPLFAEFQALEELLSQGFEPETNLYIASSHNEEIGGNGIPLAVKYFEENKINFETVLDEGGAIISPPLAGMKCNCAMMAVHEKGRRRIVCTATEGTSHAGLSGNTNTPVARMSAFINDVNTSDIFIKRLYPQVRAMFEDLCPYTPFIMRIIFSNMWLFGGLLKRIIPKVNAQAGAMVGTSCTFFEIEGNYESKKCTAKATLRCVDDKDQEIDLQNMKKIAEKYGVEITDGDYNEYHAPADMSSPCFSYAKECVAQIFPHVASAAYVLPAGTDARHLSEICPCVIRFAPIEINNQQFASVHSENENISLSAIGNAVEFYKHYVKNYK